MGQIIEKLALSAGHEIVYKTSGQIDRESLRKADAAIEFSITEAALQNIKTCFEEGVPVVCGTTGWLEDYDKAATACKKHQGSFLYASNFSIGVNMFFALNKYLAHVMKNQKDYQLKMEEIHHTQKRDQPSGTAISLAEDIIAETDKTEWILTGEKEASETQIPITAKRYEDVKGTHIVAYQSDIDSIEIKHTAYSREGFAKGAIMAAEFIHDKKGIFSMSDVLKNII